MINELYELATALERQNIETSCWHKKYNPIAKITRKDPRIKIIISNGSIADFSLLDDAFSGILHEYGSKQGRFPCMNLAPLFRVTDADTQKKILSIQVKGDSYSLNEIEQWCQCNNWTKKFQQKYKVCMKDMREEVLQLAGAYEPLQVLSRKCEAFVDCDYLYQELKRVAFEKLANRDDVSAALSVLFYNGDPNKDSKDDCGKLAVAFESQALLDMGIPAVSEQFVSGLNKQLLLSDDTEQNTGKEAATDAFGVSFVPNDKDGTMPSIKLAGGFDASLRTMYGAHPNHKRYGLTDRASYPISPETEKQLASALDWIGGDPKKKNITWMRIGDGEILFAYPVSLPKTNISLVRFFQNIDDNESIFEKQTEKFLADLRRSREAGYDSHADRIRLFILRKLDKACTKIIYTRQTNAYELEKCSEQWSVGCKNLPEFAFEQPAVPFPLDTANILNRFWKQNGEIIENKKYKPVSKYHGIELMMETGWPVGSDLHLLSEQEVTIAGILGTVLQSKDGDKILRCVKPMLALTGLLLYRQGIRKESYMEQLPYLYGQLLKAADELHTLYCQAVRGGDVPPQLAGGSLFRAATDAPIRTLNQLSQRIMPYYTWAKSYRYKNVNEKGVESWRVGWLCRMLEDISTRLFENWTAEMRFSDAEKAQLFIGYLAKFPAKEETNMNTENEEVKEHE